MAQQTILGGSGVLWGTEKVKINSNFSELYGRPAYSNLTSFVAQTAWRLFYSNADGDVIELALGADGTYLKSNGASAAPTFATPSSGDSLPSQTGNTGKFLTTDGTDASWADVSGGSMTYPGAGIPVSTGSAWGTSLTLDTDLSSVSASDDTIPSAKATKAALDLKDNNKPATLICTTDTSVSEDQLLANKYITNYGSTAEVDITLPAVSYNISRTILIDAAYIVELNPPSGEAFDLSGSTLDANDCVDSPNVIGASAVATRRQTGSATWRWYIDVVRGTWVDTGATD